MMDDRVWLEAVRRVTGPDAGRRRSQSRNPSRNPSDEAEIRRLMDRVRGGTVFNEGEDIDRDLRRRVNNPQLQVLGDYRRNPAVEAPQRAVSTALQKFHGKSDGDVVAEFEVNDGSDEEIQLAYLGHVPAVSWLVDQGAKRNRSRKSKNESSAGNKQIDVDGEIVKFFGNRHMFRGSSQPILALRIPTNEAVIVQGSVDSLRDCCDSDGIFGLSPVVEYIVEALKGSSKKDHHYVHEFEPGLEPVLRWDDSVNGLVFDRNRTLVRNCANQTKRAVYVVEDWFHEKHKRHGDQR